MKTARLFLCGLLLAGAATGLVPAQTNDAADTEKAPKPTTDLDHPEPSGPVVMPPADQAPPAPAATPPDTSASPPPSSSDTAPAPPTPPSPVLNSPTAATNAAPAEDQIDDIRPPFFFLRSWLWLWIALACVGALALAFLIANWFRGHAERKAKTAYDVALEKLEEARAMMNESDPEPYAVTVSEILRTYLGQRFHARSSRLTTEEFLREMQTDTATPLSDHRDLLGNFLQACDLVKFARYQPRQSELEEVQQSAVSFVTATRPAPAPGRQNGDTS